MENDIRQKLQDVLNKEHLEEVDIIYILSGIRKLFEINEDKRNFKVLNFYCNWALHSQIDDVDAVSEKLKMNDGSAVLSLMYKYESFDEEFKNFLRQHSLVSKIFEKEENRLQFHHLLSEIYSDTPLILKTTSKQKITFKKVERFGHNSGLFIEDRETI